MIATIAASSDMADLFDKDRPGTTRHMRAAVGMLLKHASVHGYSVPNNFWLFKETEMNPGNGTAMFEINLVQGSDVSQDHARSLYVIYAERKYRMNRMLGNRRKRVYFWSFEVSMVVGNYHRDTGWETDEVPVDAGPQTLGTVQNWFNALTAILITEASSGFRSDLDSQAQCIDWEEEQRMEMN